MSAREVVAQALRQHELTATSIGDYFDQGADAVLVALRDHWTSDARTYGRTVVALLQHDADIRPHPERAFRAVIAALFEEGQ